MSLRNSSWVLRRRIHLGISILKSLLLWVPMSRSTYASQMCLCMHGVCFGNFTEPVQLTMYSALCMQLRGLANPIAQKRLTLRT